MKRRLSVGLSIAMLATLAVSGAATAASPFQNGSFENPTGTAVGSFSTLTAGTPTATWITGWTVGAGTIDWVGTLWQAADGARSVDLNGNGPGSIYQAFDTTTGHTYRVNFALSGNPQADLGLKSMTLFALSGTDATSATFSFNTQTMANTTGDMKWQSQSFTFTATAASTTLTFMSATPTTAFGPAIDNVSVTDVTKTPGQGGVGKGGPGAQCKNGGWQHITGHTFRNQGQCVSWFATKMRHGGAGPK